MRLAFSIPVHERPDAVADTVRNVLRFNPGSVIVLHVSKWAEDPAAFEALRRDGVLINDRRLATGHQNGLFLVHSANFRYLCGAGEEFDAFCLLSSNELFIRRGLQSYVSEVLNAFQAVQASPDVNWHLFEPCQRDPQVAELLQRCGGTAVYGGQAEGQFFQKALFGEMCEIYGSVFGEQEKNDIDLTEEFVPQTIAMAKGLVPHPPFTLVDYSPMGFQVDHRAVSLLADPARIGRVRLNLGLTNYGFLPNVHQGALNEHIYALKRIPRQADHPLRQLIRALPVPLTDRAVDPLRRATALVPLFSWPRARSTFVKVCRALGFEMRMKTGLRTLFRRWFRSR